VIGHSGDTTDLAYLEELVGNGSYIGMDRFGIDTILSFEDRVETVAAMCRSGHAEKMVLSHDAACYNHWLPERPLPMILPRWHYLHIHNDVIPALKQKGVTEDQLQTMLVTNPRKVFERQEAY
jgi:Predicted metal-dependent hydrolase with the TIM-barrel fold